MDVSNPIFGDAKEPHAGDAVRLNIRGGDNRVCGWHRLEERAASREDGASHLDTPSLNTRKRTAVSGVNPKKAPYVPR